jgi:hypothetical protein
MTRIAVSGHRGLSPKVTTLIDTAVRAELAPFAADGRLVGPELRGHVAARIVRT